MCKPTAPTMSCRVLTESQCGVRMYRVQGSGSRRTRHLKVTVLSCVSLVTVARLTTLATDLQFSVVVPHISST